MNTLLPIFLKLNNQNCLVVGGGNIALQKIHQLIDSKAKVTVVAPEIIEEIKCLPVKLVYKKYNPLYLKYSKIVIAATDDINVNKKIYNDASNQGVPVNVVDEPDLCSFYMGSVYKDGDLKIAISTNGKCPSFATYIKDYLKNISKGMWGDALNNLAIKREKIIHTLSKYSEKKEVMGQIVKEHMKIKLSSNSKSGKVFLIGAGPGDPELITAKGIKAIQSADIILHDALIHPHLVFEINPMAKKIFVGKRENKHSVNQETIHSIMVEQALKGKIVVRLKGGDPFIFGRGGEEVIALAKDNIIFEIIPGITAGLAAASGFGIPLTHRDEATSTLFITGYQCQTAKKQDWKILSRLNSTLVFYMGVKRIKEIVQGLIQNGKAKDTPIAIIKNVTLNSQDIIISDLEGIIKKIQPLQKLTPAIIIIGTVVNNYYNTQKFIESIPSDKVSPINDINFDIWKNKELRV